MMSRIIVMQAKIQWFEPAGYSVEAGPLRNREFPECRVFRPSFSLMDAPVTLTRTVTQFIKRVSGCWM
jgi:hypothetical protein